MLDFLDEELERLRKLRISLQDDKELLEDRQKEFQRANARLIQAIDIKIGAVKFSEQRIYNISKDIYNKIEFYLSLKHIPIEVQLETVIEEELKKNIDSLPIQDTEVVTVNAVPSEDVITEEAKRHGFSNVFAYFRFRRK